MSQNVWFDALPGEAQEHVAEHEAIVRELAATTILRPGKPGQFWCPFPGCHGPFQERPVSSWAHLDRHAPFCLWARAKALHHGNA